MFQKVPLRVMKELEVRCPGGPISQVLHNEEKKQVVTQNVKSIKLTHICESDWKGSMMFFEIEAS